MIRYSLKCKAGHGFDSWFQNAEAFSALQSAGQVACPICGTASVEKSLMAPAVRPSRKAEARAMRADAPALTEPQSELEAAIAALRRQIEENSDYVGMNFATEARRMHLGEVPERPIHGEARLEEARKLIEEGVPVAPLPFLPARKVN
ncbi:DUF1178 family protein [Tabrizicola sp. YIM 78059]|uniref:DUF1178 family protein n=1 Tax=Tabrizicola sp. YIM 78059 TaxID=2529861 RepID=UPI0010AAD118|nr:DUF1178 family protein [Tabrizicola sp. YIM 78059]